MFNNFKIGTAGQVKIALNRLSNSLHTCAPYSELPPYISAMNRVVTLSQYTAKNKNIQSNCSITYFNNKSQILE